ncbi:MAG: small subunit ribosomal protein S20 [Parcubacteria group bacterium Gr01-1014_20]|nr:MAG: small subunit ribosomal protein S20 [Parcubacteria group bacterium Gr01-1014_20]
MPITKSAKKALRQNLTRHKQNNKKKEAYKKLVKDFRKLVSGKDADKAKEKLAKVFQALDKAAKTKVIEKNKASRLKSRLSKMIKK